MKEMQLHFITYGPLNELKNLLVEMVQFARRRNDLMMMNIFSFWVGSGL